MSEYVAKQQLIYDIEQHLKDTLTVTQMERMQTALLSVLCDYEVSRSAATNAAEASEDLLQMFLDAKTIEGRSQKTIDRYRYIMNQFFHTENVTAQATNINHIRAYLMREKRRGIADSTIAGYRDVFNSFFGWLVNEGLIRKNPCANVGTIKQEKVLRKPYSQTEIQMLLIGCKTPKERTIINFLLSTGCRVSEMCNIKVADIDLSSRSCIVYGKGKKERSVYFNEKTVETLNEYLKGYKGKYLFQHPYQEKPITTGRIRVILQEIGERAEIDNVHPHRFRRTLATDMINNEVPIQEVAAILGHEKIDTTMKYVYQTPERTKKTYERYTGEDDRCKKTASGKDRQTKKRIPKGVECSLADCG